MVYFAIIDNGEFLYVDPFSKVSMLVAMDNGTMVSFPCSKILNEILLNHRIVELEC